MRPPLQRDEAEELLEAYKDTPDGARALDELEVIVNSVPIVPARKYGLTRIVYVLRDDYHNKVLEPEANELGRLRNELQPLSNGQQFRTNNPHLHIDLLQFRCQRGHPQHDVGEEAIHFINEQAKLAYPPGSIFTLGPLEIIHSRNAGSNTWEVLPAYQWGNNPI